ncbi:MAG TPA: M14 family zinc carboxypeptidase, partial [Pyrinomonadaceae bacterium]|nr:M14 family zinc carboxypeptidase [Pyrinomonadaceae bacterium]
MAQTVPAPKDVLGWTPGDDRKLASWAKVVEYFKKLDTASDRVQFQEIGKTTMGAPFVYATISSPANLKTIEKYKQINAKLADPRTIKSSDAAAKALIAQGKTIVMITCGVHSTEVGGYLSSMLIAYRLASSDAADVKKILDNTIILLVPALNPDGVDIVNNWYQKTLGTPYEGTEPPELYHKYVGHDDNRDWYAFTQVETQLTVDKILNVWHPQIVHDIHQQGANGSRLFLPPYMDPVEPNVPKQMVEGYTELGRYMAADLRKQGFEGITTDSTYDAWTPSRAYSHYHGGVRILSETASCRLATPITVKFEDLRPGEHYDPRTEAPNFGPVWKGGEWHIGDITRYMTTAAFSLLNNAANEREKWLTRFYAVGKEAVRPRKDGEAFAFILPSEGDWALEDILQRGGVEIQQAQAFKIGTKSYPNNTKVVRMDQPYGSFAKTLFERQIYPNLLDEKRDPIRPYDVTAHTLPLLFNVKVEAFNKPFVYRRSPQDISYLQNVAECINDTNTAIYKSSMGVIDEGWTRWVLGQTKCEYAEANDKNIRNDALFADKSQFRVI